MNRNMAQYAVIRKQKIWHIVPYRILAECGITYRMRNSKDIHAQLKAFGKNLKRARMARKVTLEALAERANLNIRTLQRFEAGESNVLITTVLRLQRSLGCSWNELLSD